MPELYHEKLKRLIDEYIKLTYLLTKRYPREEIYGITSQLRRSALSVMLNYVEGYARSKSIDSKIYNNFLEISYGSLKESMYLLYLSEHLGYITKNEYQKIIVLSDEIAAMIYKTMRN